MTERATEWPTLQNMTTIDLILLANQVRDSKDLSDQRFYADIQKELKYRQIRRRRTPNL